MGRELALLPLALAFLASSVSGFRIGENNCINDKTNATVPRCSQWIDPDNKPYFFPHQYNCSLYWECNVVISADYDACLRECAPCGDFAMCDGHPALYFDEYEKPGPTCDYPTNTNCTARDPKCGECEAWQDCEILDDGTVICTPECIREENCETLSLKCPECLNGFCVDPECCDDSDCPENFTCVDGECQGCLVDDDCADNEYCDNGECKLGCRDNDITTCAMPCSECVNHVCHDPECCKDPDCKDAEYCTANNICEPGCRDNDISTCTMDCSTCVNHVCNNPECCTDPDCKDAEYCTVDNICETGCRDNDISTCTMDCSTCVNHVCNNPECCVDPDCKDEEFCTVDNICQDGCNEDSDCTGCSTCDMSINQCTNPECCVDDDCKAGWTCEDNKCTPECLVDQDCIDLDEHKPICTENNECIPGCREDLQCPDVANVCDISSYTNCDYCNMNGSTNGIGTCDDGCADNINCPEDMSCQDHVCTNGGSFVALQSIQFKTTKCEGCESTNVEKWLTMTLEGKPSTVGTPSCTTDSLDHPNKQDYSVGTTVTFEGSDDKDPLGGCYLANLQGEVRKLEVTWSGQGTWSAEDSEITFTMSDPLAFLFVCKLNGGDLSPSNPTASGVCNEFTP